MHRVLVWVLLFLALPAAARAGTVTRTDAAITYRADAATAANETVSVGLENGAAFVTSDRGVSGPGCQQTDANRVDCLPAAGFVVFLLGFDDTLTADLVSGPVTLEAHGGAGHDSLSGTSNADTLVGEDGNDTLDGRAGNDALDGGSGDDSFYDGPGDDAVTGGAGNDTWHAGTGRDSFAGGDGSDRVDYGDRTAPVTLTLNSASDDGESGEGDNIGADVEELVGGSGNDWLVAGSFGVLLRGSGGDDMIKGSPNEDRMEGEEGNDTIDARDGRFDSVDCGPGADTLLADPGDAATNCEVTPDRDGDGTANELDCAPDDPAIHPGAPEIPGNDVDEDCNGVKAYPNVEASLSRRFVSKRHPAAIRFTTLRLNALVSGDTIELRCKGKGCPFTRRTITPPGAATGISLVARLKKRFIRAGAVVEVRVLHANRIGRVFRLRVAKGPKVKQSRLCLPPGARTPRTCS